MNRAHQAILIGSTVLGSWLGMQAVHEAGHVLGAWLTGGKVARVVLHPLTISRTDLTVNPAPLLVVWAGPVFGVLAPLALWVGAARGRCRGIYVLRFFAGFCLLANGAYIGLGSFEEIGDCRQMLLHGSTIGHLWLFGAVTMPAGLWLWHGQGKYFGLGPARRQVEVDVAYCSLVVLVAMLAILLALGGE